MYLHLTRIRISFELLRPVQGLSGTKSFRGEYIEGSFHLHQVPLPLIRLYNSLTPGEHTFLKYLLMLKLPHPLVFCQTQPRIFLILSQLILLVYIKSFADLALNANPAIMYLKSDVEELGALQTQLETYKIGKVIDISTGVPHESISRVIPAVPSKRLGQRKKANGDYNGLVTPEWRKLGVQKGTQESYMKCVGEFLLEVIQE